MIELGVSILKDAMGGVNAGAYFFALSENPDDETRSTSATFLPVPPRQNLYLLLGHQATKVVLDTTHSGKVEATGVECASNVTELPLELAAAKEVILSAGALHTPQILMLSGIGDERHLSSVGIQTVVDLPGVGANHHDHPLIISAHSSKSLLVLKHTPESYLTFIQKSTSPSKSQTSPTTPPGPQNSAPSTMKNGKASLLPSFYD